MLSEVKRLETMIQQTHEETVKLAQVINELRMAMVELPATLVKTAAVEPAPAPAAAAAPAPEPVLAVEPLVKLDAVASPPAPPAETPKKLESSPPADVQTPKTKVAIFGKLWDYLNETERERPVRKSDRTN
jgi:uncharacterized membrane protein